MNIVLTLASFALLPKVVSQGTSASQGTCTTCCLSDGIQRASRQNLTNSYSQSTYAVGLWMNDLDAGHVSTAVASILIEEVLGYHTINRSSAGPQAAYRAVAGCLDPGDELSCAAGTIPSWHVALDVRQPFQATSTLPTLDFVEAGGMSYVGRRGHFVKKTVWASTSGTIPYSDLQFGTGTYTLHSFDTISSVDRGKLKQCTDTQLANTTMIRSYLDVISDTSGVTLGSGGFVAFCPADGYFWLSPSCRSDSSQCIPYFFNSYHRAVDVLEVMQKAAIWDIPWAISVAYDEASFEDVLATSRSMFFRYTPDSPLGLVSPVEVTFPEHDSAGWANGDFSSASKDVSVLKLLSQDLITLAPEVDAFIVAFDLTAAHLETLLMEAEALGSFRSGACNWLNHWPEVWQPWIQSVASTSTTSTTSTTNSTSTTPTPNPPSTTTSATTSALTTQAASAASTDDLVMGAVNPSVTASVLASMATDRTAIVHIPFSGLQYDLAMEVIGIPTVGWAVDQSTTVPGSIKELVVTPAELFLTPNPALIVSEAGSDASIAILAEEARPGQNVTVSGTQYQVSDIIVSVSLVELSSTSLSPLAVTGLGTPILIRMSTTSSATADTLCVYLDANNEWSQAGVYRPTAAEITSISGSQADTSGIWCATEHLSTFGILLAVNSETDAATECGFIETLTVDNEQCFSPGIFYGILAVPLLCCCVGFVCCYFKCRRPTKGKLKLQDQKGDAHEFGFQVEKAMTHAGGEDHGSDPAKAKIFVKWDVDIEQAKQTDYDYVKSRSGVNVTGTGLLLTTTAVKDTKSEKSNSPRSVRSRKLTEAEEEAEEATDDVHHEDFDVELVEEETDLPQRSVSGIGYEAYGNNAHIEYFSATHNKWLQGCIQGPGSLVEDGKTMVPVYTIVLFGGAHKQVRNFVSTSLLRAPLKVRDPVSIQLGKTEEDWKPGVVKSRQSFPLGYEVELLENHPSIDGNTTKVSPERIRPRFPDGSDVEVYRGVKLGWFPGVVKAGNVDNTEAWPDVVVEMAPYWESDSKEDVTCPSCHVRATQRRPLPVKSSTEHTLEKI